MKSPGSVALQMKRETKRMYKRVRNDPVAVLVLISLQVRLISNSLCSGSAIEKLCECAMEDSLADRGSVVRAARCLLGSVTKVLLLADIVVVKQLLLAKDKVARSLGRLENVSNFTEFVKAFSQFGAEMVELAHLTGDRQVRFISRHIGALASHDSFISKDSTACN